MSIKKTCFLISVAFIFAHGLYGQKYVKDSIFLKIEKNPSASLKNFQIYNFNDKREVAGHILDISEKKQYLVVPVDFLYCFNKPLEQILDSIYSNNTIENIQKKYEVDIQVFQPGLRKGGFIQQYFLNVHVGIKELNADSSNNNIGDLVYETILPYKSYKSKTDKAYNGLIEEWQKELFTDLEKLALAPDAAVEFILPNLKSPGYEYHKNLYGKAVLLAGIDWYGIEGEMFFSGPEANKFFIRNTGTIRYINADSYESLLFGKNNENFLWRSGPSFMFELQQKSMFGFNRWKDIESVEHEFWEVFQYCFSLSQNLYYNRLDKKGLIVSLGMVEDLFYIYDKVDFRFGLKLGMGIKL